MNTQQGNSSQNNFDWSQFGNLKVSYLPPSKRFSVFDLPQAEAKSFYNFVEDSYLEEKQKPVCPVCKTEMSYSEMLLHVAKCVDYRKQMYGYEATNNVGASQSSTPSTEPITNTTPKKRKQDVIDVDSGDEEAAQCCLAVNKHITSCAYQHNACSHIIQISHANGVDKIPVCKPKHYRDQNFLKIIEKRFPKDVNDTSVGEDVEQVLCSGGTLCNQGINKQPKVINKNVISVWGNPTSGTRNKKKKIYMSFCSMDCMFSTLGKLSSPSSWNKMAKKSDEDGAYTYERESEKSNVDKSTDKSTDNDAESTPPKKKKR
ncbi:hypothetical protein FDP41_012018 [Naegleria fowleri]|uniref:Uncharacterized protein n=1 Tax=Naegleria fowleri TaxID=5763 RepID=A0A6A5BXZ6_NAEFO|nr:uncharacterized protein FDP41_012018 [Naegleria fowleri]KAF0982157.1 hypothetical protein FDP41_012018 [Naegleria fowleri]